MHLRVPLTYNNLYLRPARKPCGRMPKQDCWTGFSLVLFILSSMIWGYR